jgi:hypothetical protein
VLSGNGAELFLLLALLAGLAGLLLPALARLLILLARLVFLAALLAALSGLLVLLAALVRILVLVLVGHWISLIVPTSATFGVPRRSVGRAVARCLFVRVPAWHARHSQNPIAQPRLPRSRCGEA